MQLVVTRPGLPVYSQHNMAAQTFRDCQHASTADYEWETGLRAGPFSSTKESCPKRPEIPNTGHTITNSAQNPTTSKQILVFEQSEKPEHPDKKLSKQDREPVNSTKTATHSRRIEPRTQRRKARALTTAPALSPPPLPLSCKLLAWTPLPTISNREIKRTFSLLTVSSPKLINKINK